MDQHYPSLAIPNINSKGGGRNKLGAYLSINNEEVKNLTMVNDSDYSEIAETYSGADVSTEKHNMISM
jgi:hypothetical protein